MPPVKASPKINQRVVLRGANANRSAQGLTSMPAKIASPAWAANPSTAEPCARKVFMAAGQEVEEDKGFVRATSVCMDVMGAEGAQRLDGGFLGNCGFLWPCRFNG